MELPEGPLPHIASNQQDILLEGRPQFDATTAHAYADSNWATCVKTRRSFGGSCIRLAGGTIAYKCKFHPTVAGSSTEAESMAAYDTGKMILFIRQLQSSSKTTTAAQQWAMHKNPPLALDTSTLNISPSVNGSSATS